VPEVQEVQGLAVIRAAAGVVATACGGGVLLRVPDLLVC
jgi:hypothetical protein